MKYVGLLIATVLMSELTFAGDPRTWGQRLADRTIAEHPAGWNMRTSDGEYRWAYTQGLVTLGMYRLHLKYHEPSYYAYMMAYVDHYVEADGNIRTLALDECNIDSINSGKLLFPLLQDTHEARYRAAIELLYRQLRWQPRTHNGVFWHKLKYPWQVWLDGLYMGAPFCAEYAARFGPNAYFDDIAGQFSESYAKLRDTDTGLFYHGWDESRVQRWSDPDTGRSPGFWTRSLGWYAMALVDILDVIPPEKAELRAPLLAIIPELAENLVRVQDATGVWFQIMDMPGERGNYREASASAMFTYFLAKAINRGYLPESFKPAAQKAYAGLIDEFVSVYADGSFHLTNICEVGGLGYGRDGSYRYYMSERVVKDDPKGLGPAIMAGLQVSELSS